jgi:hypothetical protein
MYDDPIVSQVEGSCKTESSNASVPLDDLRLFGRGAANLFCIERRFASHFSRGSRPFWANSAMMRVFATLQTLVPNLRGLTASMRLRMM